jgi:hypothetical protein
MFGSRPEAPWAWCNRVVEAMNKRIELKGISQVDPRSLLVELDQTNIVDEQKKIVALAVV